MMNDLQKFIYFDKYSRWLWDENRRETFEESCLRSVDYARFLTTDKFGKDVYEELLEGMLSMEAFPSMRYFHVAGPEASKHPQAMFNCSYLPVRDLSAFSETLFLLGLGVGVGYSVEKKNVYKLPKVGGFPSWIGQGSKEIVIEDSIEGWAHGLQKALTWWWNGIDPVFNFSKIRPSGTPLKTRGGFASGYEPFEIALNHIKRIIYDARGRWITPLEAHDIQCHIASAIVSGGVRRSAMISLFDYTNDEMFNAKAGEWYMENPQRAFANNSMVMTNSKGGTFWRKKMYEIGIGGYGEPGIFSRMAAENTKPARRLSAEWGTNPCGEISLRPYQFCNLSIANVRNEDSAEDIKRKARLAAIWGTIQASVSYFPSIRSEWAINQIEERLIGVDLNGQRDNPMFSDSQTAADFPFEAIRDHVVEVNRKMAEILNIRPAAAATCAKPAGNSSVLFDTASGIHPRHSAHYIRRVQALASSPIANFLADSGVPWKNLKGGEWSSESTIVFDFPVASPPTPSQFKGEISVQEQLEYWKTVKTRYTEHNPSVTIDYKNDRDLRRIGDWITENQDIMGGLSFFPYNDVKYENAPYESITEEQYKSMLREKPIDWDRFPLYDSALFGSGAQEYACVGGACEVQL